MTVQQAIDRYLSWWRSQIGYHEGANNYTKYASSADLAKLYGWKAQNQPWCDIVYDEGMIECFGLDAASAMTFQPIGKGSALCRTSAQYYKNNAAWFASPQPGDQIFFFDGAGVINHTGVVERISGGVVHTIEGNRSDEVECGAYSAGSPVIAGYGRPKWAVVAQESDEGPGEVVVDPGEDEDKDHPIGDEYDLRFHYLRYGAGMEKYGLEELREEVRAVQRSLRDLGFDIGSWGLDGEYGTDTQNAVAAYQRSVGLSPDGEVGPLTMAALLGVRA